MGRGLLTVDLMPQKSNVIILPMSWGRKTITSTTNRSANSPFYQDTRGKAINQSCTQGAHYKDGKARKILLGVFAVHSI